MNDDEEDSVPISEARNPVEEVYTRISDRELSDYTVTLDIKPVKPEDLVHFVFVVSMNDFDRYIEILNWFKEIECTIEKKGQIVKYETQDSTIFKTRYDEKVHNICEKAIFILPLLSENFWKDKFCEFFKSEVIGLTRLDDTCYKGILGKIIQEQRNDAMIPIHLDRGSTRVGFSLAKGIQYYAKETNKDYVQNQIKDLLREAIERVEKRRNAMVCALTGTDNKHLNDAALTNRDTTFPQNQTSEREMAQLSEEVENVILNNIGLSLTSDESDVLLETDNGSSILSSEINTDYKSAEGQVITVLLQYVCPEL